MCQGRHLIRIPVPMDEKHVIYVWIDALSNYLTGAGYSQDDEKFAKFWLHRYSSGWKEIMRFHTIIWLYMLMALGFEHQNRFLVMDGLFLKAIK